jgi:hypothetical protein
MLVYAHYYLPWIVHIHKRHLSAYSCVLGLLKSST